MSEDKSYPAYQSHFWPRSRRGQRAMLLFIVLFVMAEPPVLLWANRIEPWVLGMPFLYIYLLVVYAAMMLLLLWINRHRI